MKTGSRVDMRRWRKLLLPFACVLLILLSASPGWAAFGEDEEKLTPEFTREGEQVAAKVIPRGKVTAIQIEFNVSGGRLRSVGAMDFAEAARPDVDRKDFRSGLFVVKIDGFATGAEVDAAVASDYFTASTEFWVFNPKAATAWAKAEAHHARRAERVEELRVKVKDGGPLDSDGAANGEIVLICGPMDGFWGYAIGTLAIRFFGVFLVLAVIQIGVHITGRVFRFFEERAAQAVAAAPLETEEEGASATIDRYTAAAIAMALHLHLSHQRPAERLQLSFPEVSAWSLHGRGLIMGERFTVFDRTNRSETARF